MGVFHFIYLVILFNLTYNPPTQKMVFIQYVFIKNNTMTHVGTC
jgi:hypothetical protein